MVKRMPTGTWWNQLSPEKRRKVLLTINEVSSFTVNVENNMLFLWGNLDGLTQSQIETYREVDSELKFCERHQGLEQASNKHW